MSRWTNWLGPLDCTDNLKALKEAYEIGVMEMPAEVYKETGYQLNQFLDALIPGLIQALIALAASTALGGAIGAVVGAFFGGAGAIPGAVGGAAVGFDLGLAVLGWLGLGFLAYSIGHSLGELTALLELAVRRAWDAPNSPQPRVQIRLAGKDFARSGAILIRLVLQGIAMWLTQKGVNKIGELAAELRKSKLGPRFAAWVEENAAALMRDPRLKPHRGQGSAAKEVVSEAQSPSKVANRPPEAPSEAPPPKPKPASKQKLKPGSPEHKAARWDAYQERGGKWDYSRWSKQYDTNMRNYQQGLAREAEYRTSMGASEGTVKTPLTDRQIDLLKADEMYAGQVKTGPVSLTKENALAIQKDAELVKRGWQVEHILEKGASKPYIEALEKLGIDYKIGPQIP